MRWFVGIVVFTVGVVLFGSGLSAQESGPDAEFIKLFKEYRLNEDGSQETRVIKELRILTHFAFHSLYGETFVVYNPRYQKLTIHEAYTVMADSKKVTAPSNAFNEVLPRFASNFAGAGHLREMVITHTGLEVGTVIHLDYTITTAPGFYPALMAKEVLSTSAPVDSQIIEVNIPASAELHHKMLHLRTGPDIFQENGRTRYVWSFSNLPARRAEPFQPQDVAYLPTLMFSTGRDFREIFSGWTSQEAFQWNTSGDMKERVSQITSQQADPLKQALDIRKLVADEFNLFDVPLEMLGYRVRTAEETWSGNGGTEAEKSVLLCTLLKEAGIQAGLFAVIPEDLMDPTLGCLPAVKGFVVEAFPGDAGAVMLSAVRPDDQNLLADLAGHTLIPVDPADKSRTALPTTGSADAVFTLKIDTAAWITGTVSAGLRGIMNPFVGLAKDNTYAKNLLTSFVSAGSVRSYEIISSDPEQSSLEWQITSNSAFKQQDDYLFLELPALKNGFNGWQMNYLSASRTTPLSIPYSLEESYSFSLEIPDHLEMITMPGRSAISNQAGSVTTEVVVKKRTVIISRKLRLNVREITLQHYDEFRSLINEWNDMNIRRPVFRTIQ